ncbi:3-oxoacyl-[acyl-carrier-protein] synthase III [Auritidibacter ignavus]|nr:3-oxoacyl-[acyl-carrier-protein] synthase III [Auritidibacter ignavus]
MINTSVIRTHLEPAVSVVVHDKMGLPSSAMNFDITNACLGFVNGMGLAATMIDSGQVD